MPHYETLYPGRFLKKEELPAPRVIRITAVNTTPLENERGKVENKVTLEYASAAGKGEIVWCKTNARLTAIALGEDDYTKWVGHLLTIHANPNVTLGKKKVGGVRVFGSPEMTKPLTIEVKVGAGRFTKKETYHLVPTDKHGKPLVGTTAQEMDAGQEAPPDLGVPADAYDNDGPPPDHWQRVDQEAAS